MDKNLMNISKIETFFNQLLDEKVSSNTFFTDLPSTIKREWTDMVVVDCSTALSDMQAYMSGIVNVFLYAKPMSTGSKNVAKLSDMEKKLNECIASNTDAHYKISRSASYTDYDENRNLHCNIVQIQLIVL